jgi:hypothetical protein
MNILFSTPILRLLHVAKSKKVVPFTLILALAGCYANPTIKEYAHSPSPNLRISNTYPSTIAIAPWKDNRVKYHKSGMIALVPLVPYGNMHVQNGADDPILMQDKPIYPDFFMAEFPSLLKRYLEDTNRFSKPMILESDEVPADVDYVVEPEINTWGMRGKLFFYGLSLPGDLLWLLGLPAMTMKMEGDFVLSLKDADSGKILFRREYRGSSKTHVQTFPLFFAWFYGGHMRAGHWEPEDMLPFVRKSLENFTEEISRNLPPPDDKAQWESVAARRATRVAKATGISPLEIFLSYPSDGLRLSDTEITPEGLVRSQLPIESVRILHNGREVGSISIPRPAPKELVLNFPAPIPLVEGANRIQIEARDTTQLSQTRLITVFYDPSAARQKRQMTNEERAEAIEKIQLILQDAEALNPDAPETQLLRQRLEKLRTGH